MRTTLDIDDSLLRGLMARHPDETKTRAIERAIRSYLRRDAVAKLRAMAGTIDAQDLSAELRRIDRRP
jgi:hypothetical protein